MPNAEYQLAIILKGLTPILQPLDVALNKLFRDWMAALCDKWMMEQDGKPQTLTGRVKCAPLCTAAQCTREA
ncbi:hypothetical protein HPB48_002280 [Haemaphysalis longicornis]|uniref:Uncharacterized protein n=1 Tax=Haemaphysalis longicornis TaxID=44386 RepID=A0A9J6F7Z0_HAELO|nr:hypothetical protein HPB48_002280 [Haemaphysalis longicornis]